MLIPEYWEKACVLLEEMESFDIKPDTIACSALMRAFNKGGEPSKVMILAEFMRENNIPFGDAVFYEMVSACSLLRDWRTTLDLVKLMEPSFSVVSIGLLNQLLHLLGKTGKTDSMMKLFYKIIASAAEVSFNTYSILLKNLLAVGNWRKYIEVLEWMADAGTKPSNEMYCDIICFAEKSAGAKCAAIIRERVESLKEKYGN
uniref:Pentatricopeptide repeat-containing protein At2g41720 isoform X2 n=1 Tax=Rhizophora mucronata TaxID=61149 RepID=A0A2P2KV72_RHIMU